MVAPNIFMNDQTKSVACNAACALAAGGDLIIRDVADTDLVVFSPILGFDPAVDGVAVLQGTPIVGVAVAAGTAAKYVVRDSAANTLWTGSVGTDATFNLTLDNLTITLASVVTISDLEHSQLPQLGNSRPAVDLTVPTKDAVTNQVCATADIGKIIIRDDTGIVAVDLYNIPNLGTPAFNPSGGGSADLANVPFQPAALADGTMTSYTVLDVSNNSIWSGTVGVGVGANANMTADTAAVVEGQELRLFSLTHATP